jgi:hypothetical protein
MLRVMGMLIIVIPLLVDTLAIWIVLRLNTYTDICTRLLAGRTRSRCWTRRTLEYRSWWILHILMRWQV